MPEYVAFLRAINLGPRRRFPAADVARVTASAGGTEVETYLSTGNVRLTSARRSVAAVAGDLQRAYAADRGFDVPVVVLTPSEVRAVVDVVDALRAEHGDQDALSITLYPAPPDPSAVAAVEALTGPDRALVRDRVAYVFLRHGVQGSALLGSREFRALGAGTARTERVLREVARRWCS